MRNSEHGVTGGRSAPPCSDTEEQFFYLINVTPVRDEKDHMVIRLNHGVMVCHDDFVTPDDTADSGALR